MTKPDFDIDAALKQLREGKDLTGKDGILRGCSIFCVSQVFIGLCDDPVGLQSGCSVAAASGFS